jgi:hypothetical protein
MQINIEEKRRITKRFQGIMTEQKKWRSSWQELAKYINPTRGRFSSRPNDGTMIDHKTILDGHATRSSRILASGMQSGVTSPTRPWFRLRIPDQALMKTNEVRIWLDEVSELMLDICNNSNIYGTFYQIYEEVGDFGVAAGLVEEDIDDVIVGHSFTIGEYALGINKKGEVDSFAREFELQVSAVVDKFGYENCSDQTQGLYATDRFDEWVPVYHLIRPNPRYNAADENSQEKPFESLYWESNAADRILSRGGYYEFPVIAPRWDTITTSMIYGYGPGWHALGDIKQLQKTQLDKLLAQEKSHNPPVQKDSSVEGYVNLLPGGVTTTSSTVPNGGLRPAYQVNSQLESFLQLIDSLRSSIDKNFFVDLFLMLTNVDKKNMTATEVAERQQEKVLMMGPILEKLQKEMLAPFIKRLFGIMKRNFLLPEPPEEIVGADIEIEYVSILAQAQKAVGVDSISRVIGFLNAIVPVKQDVVDVFDFDEAVREVAKLEGVSAKMLMKSAEVQQMRQQRQAQAQAQQQMQMANQAADSAKKASQAKLDDNNALSSMMENMT